MGGNSGATAAANESNRLLEEQNRLARQQEKLKLAALQKEEFDIVSDQTGGNFSAKKPTQGDYPIPSDDPGDDNTGNPLSDFLNWARHRHHF